MANLVKSADLHMKYFYQVKEVVICGHPDAPRWIEWEDYGADAHKYMVWADDPWKYERYECPDDERPHIPLTPGRRAELKALGFEFKRNGDVLYKGVRADDWVHEHIQ